MKRKIGLVLFLLVIGLALFACAEETETFTSGDYEYTLNEDGSAVITKYNEVAEYTLNKDGWVDVTPHNYGELTVPSELDGHTVTTIGGSAFSQCYFLTTITLPDSVTSIGDGAFAMCSLTSITLPDSITSIGDSAFYMCIGLTEITLPDSVTSIGDSAFFMCSLTEITLPDSVTSIGDSAFSFCNKLTTITVTEGSYAEQYCIDNGLPYQYTTN